MFVNGVFLCCISLLTLFYRFSFKLIFVTFQNFSFLDVFLEADPYAGCPKEIFSLKTLVRLNLSFQGFKRLTEHIEELPLLEELNLSHNPVLEALPGEISGLTSLKGYKHFLNKRKRVLYVEVLNLRFLGYMKVDIWKSVDYCVRLFYFFWQYSKIRQEIYILHLVNYYSNLQSKWYSFDKLSSHDSLTHVFLHLVMIIHLLVALLLQK